MAVHFQPLTREQMDANHAAWRARRRDLEPAPGPRPLNVQQVLDLGNVIYFTFRGRAYGIPPLGWRPGQRLLLLWTEALSYPSPLTHQTAPRYYRLIEQLPALLWRHCRPAGLVARWLWRLRLIRNPFRHATEAELVELAAFFLGRRSSSSIGLRPATRNEPPGPPTSSTTWPTSATDSPPGSIAGASR